MKTLKTATLLFSIAFMFNNAIAQFSSEKTVELTGKSKSKGYLGSVTKDDSKQQFDLTFVTKSTNKKIKFEVYTFDYNLNLLSNIADEQEVKSARSKYKWFKYRGDGDSDVETIEGATAEPNMSGNLVLRKIQTKYTYNWYTGRYEKESKVLDKVKPKQVDEDGDARKLTYVTHQNIDSKGELEICVMIKKKIMELVKEPGRDYMMIRVDKDLNIIDKVPFSFEHPQTLIYSGSLPSGGEADDDMVMVFAPFNQQGYNKVADPNPTNCTYIRTTCDGKIKDRISFNTKCNLWAIYDVVESEADGSVYLYGPGLIDKPEKNYCKAPYGYVYDILSTGTTRDAHDAALENEKFENLQVMKIIGGKVAFISAPSIEDINSKSIKPPAQSKLYEFNGKQFVLNNINITGTGDLFIDGQDFRKSKDGARVFKDILMFQFDKDGNFKRFYGIENTAKSRLRAIANAKAFPSKSSLTESPNSKSLVWNIFLVMDVDEDCSSTDNGITKTTTCTYTPLLQGSMGKIDIASGTISDFKKYGGEDFYLYMDLENDKGNKKPFFYINDGSESIYLARQRKGGYTGLERWGTSIWLGKFDPTKL